MQPFKATQLYALAVPSRSGDTLFASAYAAYDALRDQLKKRLDGVMGAFSYGGRRGRSPLLDKEDRDWKPVYPSDHPHASRDRAQRRFISIPARSSTSAAATGRRAMR